MSQKYVYMFSEGNAQMKNLLGGKGANLAEMTRLNLPIPQGFTVTTEACTIFNRENQILNETCKTQILEALQNLEKIEEKTFGDETNPLLVSVRSGARASMPGMMDTVLNLGLNDQSVLALANNTQNPRFAYDSYRRFIMMFSDVVMGVDKNLFEQALEQFKEAKSVKEDIDLGAEDFKQLVDVYKQIYKENQGKEFPQNPKEQLFDAVCAVFKSWDNPRAYSYRKMYDIPYDWGTAVNVQAMVFGNMGPDSGTAVVFSRNPASGADEIYGEYLINAQGEDVVAGIRTPKPFAQLQMEMPKVYEEFINIAKRLETHYKDMQDMEITIERGKLYFLQTRNGKRTAQAALKIAVDMVEEGLIEKDEALLRLEPKQLDTLLHPTFVEQALTSAEAIGKGLPASPGAASGKVYFTADDCVKASKEEEEIILVRLETSPEDIEGMAVAKGILTVRGGMTSHAAVVARGMGTCCVSGCEEIKMNEKDKCFILGSKQIKEGDYISLDGNTGYVYKGKIESRQAEISKEFATVIAWAKERKTLGVRANADTEKDAIQALKNHAEGIGLTRTEHMFFDENRILKMRIMIMSDNEEERVAALSEILPDQKNDFKEIYKVMKEKPVTIRLLDPPLHEFLPNTDEEFEEIAKATKKTVDELKRRAKSLHEINPMMGHRGCRLAVSYPEIAKMQTSAIIEAAIEIREELGYDIKPQLMIPLIGNTKEMAFVKQILVDQIHQIFEEKEINIPYEIGTMIEIPRACLIADEIASYASFFSFGTNDLTQLLFGLSRDDAGGILNDYMDKNIYEFDPTAKIDQQGVGRMMKMAVDLAKTVRPEIELGICGEHGGEPSSVKFCHQIGLNYVSCSPFRIPIATLAAAQAAIAQEKELAEV